MANRVGVCTAAAAASSVSFASSPASDRFVCPGLHNDFGLFDPKPWDRLTDHLAKCTTVLLLLLLVVVVVVRHHQKKAPY